MVEDQARVLAETLAQLARGRPVGFSDDREVRAQGIDGGLAVSLASEIKIGQDGRGVARLCGLRGRDPEGDQPGEAGTKQDQ